eukprot:SAG22_NODE_9460_length_588_cov_1.265849_1_plen_53_part_10
MELDVRQPEFLAANWLAIIIAWNALHCADAGEHFTRSLQIVPPGPPTTTGYPT